MSEEMDNNISDEKVPHTLSAGNVLIDENDSILNFCISDTPLQKPSRSLTKFKSGIMTQTEFHYLTHRLYQCCLKPVRDMHQLHKNRIKGIKIIDQIILRAKSSYISVPHVMRITWSIMSCIHHFQLRLRSGTSGMVHYARRRIAERCLKLYSKLIRLFESRMHRIVLNAILVFYKEGKLWEFEFACTDLIVDLMSIYSDFEEAMNDILNIIETVGLSSSTEARHLTQILNEVLRKASMPVVSEELMNRMLSMMDSSIVPKKDDKINYVPLRRGLEMCIRNMVMELSTKGLLAVMKIMLRKMVATRHEETVTGFGNIMACAARRYRPKTFLNHITPEIFNGINSLITAQFSESIQVSANIWHNLLDRNDNLPKFSSPRIYLQDCDYKIKINKCLRTDKIFFRSWRSTIFDVILINVRDASTRNNLESIFQIIAISLTEIPCGYTAATYVTTALSIQDYAFRLSSQNLVKSHHLHALVLSIMSLICYVHKAKVLYEYVNSIMERRAEWAPHLNPPLKVSYEYAQHHILWNRPDLFFEDWEARYGLWKCFRVKKKS